MAVQNPPEGYLGVTPYLIVSDGDAAIGWYEKALGAKLVYRMVFGDKVGHAELSLGGGHFMLAAEFPDMGFTSPLARGGTTVSMLLYVDDVDAAHATAIAAGATEAQPLQVQMWGDRSCQIIDPFGHRWTLATHVEDVPNDEIDRRMADYQPG